MVLSSLKLRFFFYFYRLFKKFNIFITMVAFLIGDKNAVNLNIYPKL